MPGSTATYFDRLDAIRGVAIFWVVCYHLLGATCGWDSRQWEQGWDAWPWWASACGITLVRLLGMGGLGVPMFFVLSGFLIHYTHCRASDQRISLFWFRRWGRIYPPYLVALLAFTLWSGMLWYARGRTNFWTHLFLVHNFQDRTLFGINGSFWSLAHEAQFYFLYPFLLLLRKRVGMHVLLYGALALRMGIGVWIQLTPGHFESDPATALMLPRLYFEWILGMYVADCFLQGKRAVAYGTGAAWLCMGYICLAGRREWFELGVVPAVALLTAIWIDQIVHGKRAPWSFERALMPLGVISYSIYLWHQPIINELSRRVVQTKRGIQWLGEPGLIVLAFALGWLATVIVGNGAYHLFEVPSMQFTKRWAKWWSAQVPASGTGRDSEDKRTAPEIHEDQVLTFPRKAA
jgi:peptidoglycan/LPS O-acetylase OafA/YrhL